LEAIANPDGVQALVGRGKIGVRYVIKIPIVQMVVVPWQAIGWLMRLDGTAEKNDVESAWSVVFCVQELSSATSGRAFTEC